MLRPYRLAHVAALAVLVLGGGPARAGTHENKVHQFSVSAPEDWSSRCAADGSLLRLTYEGEDELTLSFRAKRVTAPLSQEAVARFFKADARRLSQTGRELKITQRPAASRLGSLEAFGYGFSYRSFIDEAQEERTTWLTAPPASGDGLLLVNVVVKGSVAVLKAKEALLAGILSSFTVGLPAVQAASATGSADGSAGSSDGGSSSGGRTSYSGGSSGSRSSGGTSQGGGSGAGFSTGGGGARGPGGARGTGTGSGAGGGRGTGGGRSGPGQGAKATAKKPMAPPIPDGELMKAEDYDPSKFVGKRVGKQADVFAQFQPVTDPAVAQRVQSTFATRDVGRTAEQQTRSLQYFGGLRGAAPLGSDGH